MSPIVLRVILLYFDLRCSTLVCCFTFLVPCRPPTAFSPAEMEAVQSRLGRVVPAEHIHRVRFSTDHLGPAPVNPAGGTGERPSKLRRLKTGTPGPQRSARLPCASASCQFDWRDILPGTRLGHIDLPAGCYALMSADSRSQAALDCNRHAQHNDPNFRTEILLLPKIISVVLQDMPCWVECQAQDQVSVTFPEAACCICQASLTA